MATCTSCGREFAAVSDADALCPQCSAEATAPLESPAPPPAPWQRFAASPTNWLVALNLIIFAAAAITSRHIVDLNPVLLRNWGANVGPLTCGGQWWRLLSCTFLHAGFMHVALNLWVLYNLGWLAELLFGRARFVALYLLCGVGSSLASLCWRGNSMSVGASGAIFGVAGALLAAMLLEHNARLRAALKGQLAAVAIFVGYSLLAGATHKGTDNAAHVGGLLTGILLGTALPSGLGRSARYAAGRAASALLLVVAILFGLGIFAAWRNRPYVEAELAQTLHRHANLDQAVVHARRAAQLQPQSAQAQFMYGTYLLEQKEYAEALAPLRTVTQLRLDWGPGWVNLCLAQLELGQLTEARTSCEHGARLAPTDSESWFNLGRVRYMQQDKPGARNALAKAVELNPNGFDENLQYALILIEGGQTAQAIPFLEKARELHPDDADTQRLLFQARRFAR